VPNWRDQSATHGQWLARNVPRAEVLAEEILGHFTSPDLVTERFGWLVRSSGRH